MMPDIDPLDLLDSALVLILVLWLMYNFAPLV